MIRPIQGRDTETVVALWNRALPRDTTTTERFAKWLFADPDFDVHTGDGAWVAEENGKVAGFIRAVKRTMPNDRIGPEENLGWMPVLFVAEEHRRKGIGDALITKALDWHKSRKTKRIWLCGNSGSAPGYIFPGVDIDTYPAALALYKKHGFVVDREAVSMSGPLLDFDVEAKRKAALAAGAAQNISVETLRPETVMAFLSFLRTSFPGDWNAAARNKIKGGGMSQILIAMNGDKAVGYCQYESDGHFGPFGVDESMRGKGVGALLFLESCRRMKDLDIRHAWFNWADPDAARFYSRLDIFPTRRFAVMRKDLA
ncbi:hypothetical protein BH09SUM1_BH09SUM1_25430 [soil metagenome]